MISVETPRQCARCGKTIETNSGYCKRCIPMVPSGIIKATRLRYNVEAARKHWQDKVQQTRQKERERAQRKTERAAKSQHTTPQGPKTQHDTIHTLGCFCGKVFKVTEGYGCFCSVACSDRWARGCYFDWNDYKSKHPEAPEPSNARTSQSTW